MLDKSVATVEEAIADVKDGAVIAIPGFFVAGVPRILLRAIIKKGVKNITLACGCGSVVGAREEWTTEESYRFVSALSLCEPGGASSL